ncbi:MAG: sugar phosphate nucleotidyltransferase [Acidimicrobiales bacterium]
MKAVVLVGGQGTRLRPLTLSYPKPMLPVAEVSIIERVVRHLGRHGVDTAVLSMGYQPDVFVDAFPSGKCAGVDLVYAVEPEPLDTAGGIAFAARHTGLDRDGETMLVVNGDVLTDIDVSALVAFHRERNAEGTIALTPVDDPSAFGVVPTSDDGRVTAFIEKPEPGTAPTNLINAGIYVLEASVIDRIPAGEPVNIERATFPAVVADGRLYAKGHEEYWTDTGTPALFLQANLDLLSGSRPGAPAPHAHERSPGVWAIGSGVVRGTINSPALLGDAVFVDGAATIERSVIGAGARIEADAVVRGSVILPGAVVHRGAVVEDSIVGGAAIIGAGARVAGLSVIEGEATVAADSVHDGARVAREGTNAP